MKKYSILILFWLLGLRVYSQCPSNQYVRELGKFCQIRSCRIENGEVINMVISFFNEEEYRYGKWKFYYPNGELKEEGYITLESADRNTRIEPGYTPKAYDEKKVGRWMFYDEQGNKTVVLEPWRIPVFPYFH